MSHPRISVFAGSAKGIVDPIRVITGQASLLARTMHTLSLDSVHDEIVVPNPFAEALLFFRAAGSGEEKPIRIIQGPKTMLTYTDNAAVDPVHNEVFTSQRRTDSVMVFSREANGDVAPIRVIHGPKTKLDRPVQVSVDPVNNILAVTTMEGLWIFNRTDNGDVAPRAIISGPKTGISGGNSELKVMVYPEGKKIFVSGGGPLKIWNYDDNGDVPPWGILTSSSKTEMHGSVSRVAINRAAKELIVLNRTSGVFIFSMPDLIQ